MGRDFVPMDALLAGCSAVVHMGGYGVMSTAILHGVPQLTLPKLGDSTVRADLLRDAGAGLVISHDEATPEAVRDSVSRLLTEPASGDCARRCSPNRPPARWSPPLRGWRPEGPDRGPSPWSPRESRCDHDG